MRVSFFLLACACGALRLPPLARGGALLLPRGTAVMMAKKAAVKKDGATTAALHCTHMAACASTASPPLPSRHHTLSLIGVALTAVAVKVLLTETIKGVGNKGEVTTSTSSDPPPRPRSSSSSSSPTRVRLRIATSTTTSR